jgi:hypothetical protein
MEIKLGSIRRTDKEHAAADLFLLDGAAGALPVHTAQ